MSYRHFVPSKPEQPKNVTPITSLLDATFERYRAARERSQLEFTREAAEDERRAYRDFLRAVMSEDERAYFDRSNLPSRRSK